MSNKFKCKNCGSEIEITEAIRHEIEGNLIRSIESEHKKELAEVVKKAEEKASLKAEGEIKNQLEDLNRENEEEKERNQKLSKTTGDLLEELRKLRRKDQDREIEMKKKIIDSEEKIRVEASKSADERNNLKIAELEKKLTDTEKTLVDAQSKTRQGSQQLQGEVLELDLENRLRDKFRNDEIKSVGKGVSGADMMIDDLLNREEYLSHKNKLIEEKARLRNITKDNWHSLDSWFELVENFLNTAYQARKVLDHGEDEVKVKLLKKLGSNLYLNDKKLEFSFNKPFDVLLKPRNSADFSQWGD